MNNVHTLNTAWRGALFNVMQHGRRIAPRGFETRELLHQTVFVDMAYSVLTYPERKLSYQFMAAEAHWILTGDDRVETIAPFNPNISQFSDDGKTFFGAYGPRIQSQLAYVIETLLRDPETRQAGLTLWRPNPPQSKDIPCTIAIFASIRDRHVHLHVFMRSSDIWLGLPYDMFTFSMLGYYLCGELNAVQRHKKTATIYKPGSIFLTTVSQHLYERDAQQAMTIPVSTLAPYAHQCPLTPTSGQDVISMLSQLRYTRPGDPRRWWEGTEHGQTNV